MTPYSANIVLTEIVRYRGDSSALTIPLTDPDAGGAPFNPTGCTLLFALKINADDADVDSLVQKSSDVGGITLATPSVVSFVPSDYTAIVARFTYQWGIKAQNSTTGAVKTVARGTLYFADDVPKSAALSIPTVTTNPATGNSLAVQQRSSITGLASSVLNSAKLAGLTTGPSASPTIATGARYALCFPVTVNDGAGTHAGFLTMEFQLQVSTQATVAPSWFRPYDYAPVTNERAWRLLFAALDTLPAAYNADTGKFHYMGAAGTANSVFTFVDQIGTAAPA